MASLNVNASDAPELAPHDHSVFYHKVMRKTMVSCVNAVTSSFREVLVKDTAKTIYAFKMALALLLAFLLVLVRVPYDQLGGHAIWAIMTVISVFELTIGATFRKGLNRGVGTLMAGLLAIGVGEMAGYMSGGLGYPIFISFSVFLVGGVATFAKQWPSLKSYEFGFRIFLISFSLIMVAECRGDDPISTAINRFLIILLGAAIGVSVNVFLLPCWAGNDLHCSLVSNFYGVADSLEACVNEYLRGTTLERVPSKVFMGKTVGDLVYKGYKLTLSSANKEASLAGFASWEPPHGRFKLVKYPWHQYVKVGAVLRHCAYSVVALHGCLQSAIQAPLKVREWFEIEIRTVGIECALVLRKLGRIVEDMHKENFATLLQGVEHGVNELEQSLYHGSYLLIRKERRHAEGNVVKRTHSWPSRLKGSLHFAKEPLLEQRVRVVESPSALSVGTFATLLMEVALRLDYLVDAVCELSELASFADKKEEKDTDAKIEVKG